MKKIIYLSVFLLAFFVGFSFTTVPFEGKLTYDVSVTGATLPEQAKAMFAGSKITLYIKGMNARTEMEMAMQTTISIADNKEKTSVTLMDLMGHKFMIKSDHKKEAEKAPEVTVKELNETKTIAGYFCKKAEVFFKDKSGKEQSTFLFYSEEIANQMGNDKNNYFLQSIKGMPLEYEIHSTNGMVMKMTATSISKEEVPNSKFAIPEGYKETTQEDLKKEMMELMSPH
jgi:GLPGLI family protein